MTDEMKEKYKELFDSIVNELLEAGFFNGMTLNWNVSDKKGNYQTSRYAKKNTQYDETVFWFRFLFDTEIKKNLDNGFDDVEGIHIMPFCITAGDVNSAYDSNCSYRNTLKDKHTHKCVKKECKVCHFCKDSYCTRIFKMQDLSYIDLDWNTFNIHKHLSSNNMRYQVVLVTNKGKGYGPYKRIVGEENRITETAFFKLKHGRETHIKTNWYFPSIQENESIETCDITEYLNSMDPEIILNDESVVKLKYLLAIDIIHAMHTVLSDKDFYKYISNIFKNETVE